MPSWDKTKPVPQEVIDREVRYAMALGIVTHAHVSGVSEGRYRRWMIRTSDGESYTWTPAQVLAFAAGVRLATERKGS